MVLHAAWQVSEQLEGAVGVFAVGVSCLMLGCFLPCVRNHVSKKPIRRSLRPSSVDDIAT